MRRSEKLTGTAGELFTAFELTMLGIECDLIKQDGLYATLHKIQFPISD